MRHLSVEYGLASREVLCGLQDNKGFIWLGTRNGLNRYDGENFVLFSKKTGLRFNTVVQLVQPESNELWIFYGVSGFSKVGGNMVDIMNPETHEIKSFTDKFPQCPFAENTIMGMKALGNGSYILLTLNGYFKYTPITHGFEKIYDKNAALEYFLLNINLFYHDYAWINDGKHKIYTYVNGIPKTDFENQNKLRMIIGMRDNGTCIAGKAFTTSNYLYEIKINGEETIDTTIQNLTHKKFKISGGMFWIHYDVATNSSVMNADGLYCFENNTYFELLDSASKSKLPDFVLYDYFVDRQKRKWICTSIGTFVFSRKQNNFQSLFNDSSSNAFKERFNQARCISTNDKGDVFANIGATICRSNAKGEIQQQFFSGFLLNGDRNFKTIVYGLVNDKKIYAGLTNSLLIIDSGFSKTSNINVSTLGEIWTIFRLDSNRLIGGCSLGYFIYDETQKAIVLKQQIPKMFLYHFARDRAGKLWGSGALGLYEFDESEKIKTYYSSDAKNKEQQIPYSDLTDLYIDKEGIFWLATNGDGLYRWDKNKNIFEHFTRDDGFSSNLLYGVLEDDFGNLWLSSDYGLNRFNKSTHITTIYTTDDGLNNNEFNRTSFFKAPDGRMFFGGINGVNAFYPRYFNEDTVAFNAPFQIISCNIFDSKQNKLADKTIEVLTSHEIILQPGDAFFNLQFQLLDFETGKHHFAYRINGIDKDWNYINENSIRISGLPFGNYQFHIKAQNPIGLWSANEINISIIVVEPLLHRTWFRLLMLIGGVFITISIIRYRFYRLSKDKEALEKTVELRTGQMRDLLKDKDMLMREIHHRVKNNLQVISGLLELQGARTNDENIKSTVTDIQNRVLSISFIHQNLYQHDDLSGVEFSSFVNELTGHIKKIFTNPDCTIEVNNLNEETILDIDTAISLGLIINELLTNSFKYAFVNKKQGTIILNIRSNGAGDYTFNYFDNGIGLPDNLDLKKANSLGLRLIRNLTKQLAGTITYKNENGSLFELNFKNMEARNKM